MKRKASDKYGRGSAAANGAGFVDLAPGDTFDGLEKQLRARIAEVYENPALGILAAIGSKRNANELAKHMARGEDEEVHKFAAKNVGVLFERGQLGIRHFDKKAMPGQRWVVRFFRIFTPFVFDGEQLLATITLKENKIGGNFYSVEAVDITKDARPERTPRGAIPEGLNAAPLLDLAPFVESIVAYYVGDCNRTRPEFVNRTEPFSVARAAELVAALVFNAESQNPLDAAPVHDWLAQARNLGYMLTNLFPDDRKIADWLRRDAISSFDGTGGCRLLVIREDGFTRLFYAAESLESAVKACRAYAELHVGDCVLDIVGPQPMQLLAVAAFAGTGFSVRKSLTRMQRRRADGEGSPSLPSTVRLANENDVSAIHAALQRFFDARAEQLPCLEEVGELCTNGASFVFDADGEIAAFLLGEIRGKKGLVRYWFTMPAGRGKGVGGSLMKAFFGCCAEKGATFQELWVLDDNDNAIKRYEHYGFKFDRLKDTVFIKEKR